MTKNDILIVTTNDVAGYEIQEVYGEVFGLVVRSRNIFGNIGAAFRAIFGGEVYGYTKLLASTREAAIERLRDAARSKGANAILMMRFDTSEINGIMNEVAAYGTAVKIVKKK